MITSRQLFYSRNTNLSVNDIYMLAQRDTYYLGILILVVALIIVILLPHSIILNKIENFTHSESINK